MKITTPSSTKTKKYTPKMGSSIQFKLNVYSIELNFIMKWKEKNASCLSFFNEWKNIIRLFYLRCFALSLSLPLSLILSAISMWWIVSTNNVHLLKVFLLFTHSIHTSTNWTNSSWLTALRTLWKYKFSYLKSESKWDNGNHSNYRTFRLMDLSFAARQ